MVFGHDQGKMPTSRMGSAYLMRDVFVRARTLMNEQVAYCSRANPTSAADTFPDDLELNGLGNIYICLYI
jgi:hypothetical protein